MIDAVRIKFTGRPLRYVGAADADDPPGVYCKTDWLIVVLAVSPIEESDWNHAHKTQEINWIQEAVAAALKHNPRLRFNDPPW